MKTSLAILLMFCLCCLSGCEKNTDTPEIISGTVVSNGTQLTYFIEGEGYPCIVYGDMTDMISKGLKNHFKFIFLNSRSGNEDSGEVDSFPFDLLTQDIEKVRIALKIDKVGVFGHSMWGLIPLEYARRYPQHTAFVIMNGTPPYLNDRFWSIQATYWNTNASQERKAAYAEKTKGISIDVLNNLGTSDASKYAYILSAAWTFYDFNFDITPYLEDEDWSGSVGGYYINVLMPGYDILQDKPIDAPVFLALGKFDFRTPYIVWDEEQVGKIPNLSVNLFEKSGHYPFFEEEELFRTKLIAWVENTVIW